MDPGQGYYFSHLLCPLCSFPCFSFFPLTPVITQFISFTIAFASFPWYSEGIRLISIFQKLKAFILNPGAFST